MFSPIVNLPIFSGGRNQANLEAAKIGKMIEITRYERSIQNAFREVADSLAARNGLSERIIATKGLVSAQQRRTDLASVRHEMGVDGYLEVLTATLDLYDAKQTLIKLRKARAINSVNLYKALGGGW